MVLFGSLLDQFVSYFVPVFVLSTFEFDAVQFMKLVLTFRQSFFINGPYGLGQLFCLKS